MFYKKNLVSKLVLSTILLSNSQVFANKDTLSPLQQDTIHPPSPRKALGAVNYTSRTVKSPPKKKSLKAVAEKPVVEKRERSQRNRRSEISVEKTEKAAIVEKKVDKVEKKVEKVVPVKKEKAAPIKQEKLAKKVEKVVVVPERR